MSQPTMPLRGDEAMEKDLQHTMEQGQTELPPTGTCLHHPDTMADYIIRAAVMPIRQTPREELGPLPIFTIPTKARRGPATSGHNNNGTSEHMCTFGAARKQDKGKRRRNIELWLSLMS